MSRQDFSGIPVPWLLFFLPDYFRFIPVPA